MNLKYKERERISKNYPHVKSILIKPKNHRACSRINLKVREDPACSRINLKVREDPETAIKKLAPIFIHRREFPRPNILKGSQSRPFIKLNSQI